MTEAEARTKWCPFVRQLVTLNDYQTNPVALGFGNRFKGDEMAHCIGSACMAWRLTNTVAGISNGDLDYHGFCGLAGKP